VQTSVCLVKDIAKFECGCHIHSVVQSLYSPLRGCLSAGLELVLGEGAGGPQLRRLATSMDPTVRMRTISLVANLAAGSPQAAAAVRSKGGCLSTVIENMKQRVSIQWKKEEERRGGFVSRAEEAVQ